MTFKELLAQVIEWLQQDRRVSYRSLKRQFNLDDSCFEDLQEGLLYTYAEVIEDDGHGFVWTGDLPTPSPHPPSETDSETRFQALLSAVIGLLRGEQRVTYRTLKYVHRLDDGMLEEIRRELAFKRLAIDENGEGLVWTGEVRAPVPPTGTVPPSQPYTLETPHDTSAVTPTAAPLVSLTPTETNGSTTASEIAPTEVSLDEPVALSEPVRGVPEAERRQLTVMFCDLVGSTELAAQLDPEELREVVQAYQQTAAEVIERYEGYIAQYLGDGLLIYFGYPIAHEDASQRAVYTGMEIPEAIATLNRRLKADYGVQLAVRIGIHTGPVVVGEMGGGGRHENLALGETPNIAARLEGLAQPNTTVMSQATALLAQRSFVLDALGAHVLKGLSEPMPLFALLGPRAADTETEATTVRGFANLVGRDEEIGLLLRCWEQCKEGVGHLVFLSGAAGIGKSSLVEGLRDHVRREGLTQMVFRCSPYHQNSALYPVLTHIERLLTLQSDEAADTKLAKLEQVLQRAALPLEEVVPLWANLFSIPLPEGRYPRLDLTPQQQRQRTHDTLVAWLLATAERQPLLAVWEDLHWADPSTLEQLGLLIEQAPTAPILNVLTFRPEFEAPWPTRSHQTPIVLNRLERAQVVSLIAQAAHGKAVPEVVVEHIVRKADGVPLYVEELTKMLLVSEFLREEEGGYVLTGQLTDVAIPDTLQDSLMARLDQLGQAKEVAQLGAILGREFSYEMLQTIAARDDGAFQADLAKLVEAELLYQRGRPPRATYIFKHALIQDAAYASLLRSTRQQVHRQVAELLEERFAAIVESQPELVAHHYTEAGHFEPALIYWQRAGQHAARQFAYSEAVSHFEHALAALAQLPENDTTMTQAIDVRQELHLALLPFDGYEQMLDHLREAARLAEALSDHRRMGRVASRMAPLFYRTAEYENAIAACQRTLALAELDGDIAPQVGAHLWLGFTYYALGDYPQAETFLMRNVTILEGELRYQHLGRLHPPSVGTRFALTRVQAELGAFSEGMAHGDEAIRIAKTMGHLPSEILACEGAGFLSLIQGDFDRATSMFEHAHAHRQAISFRGYDYPYALAGLGYAYARCGHVAKGLPLLEQAVEQSTQSISVIWLSEAHAQAGSLAQACSLAERALEVARRQKERGWEARGRRLLGDLALQGDHPDPEAAEAHYRQSLRLAEELGMRPLQAHCRRGLGTLYHQTGEPEQARAELTTATEMYRDMDMTFWLPETEAALEAV